MRHLYSILFVLALLPSVLSAQKQSNVWVFGNGAGVDFNGGAPVGISSSIVQYEGTASIADGTTGQLLFYTNGTKVWNRNHQIMPNGHGLVGSTSATQAAVIVPKPESATEYYVFTVDAGPYTGQPSRGLFYSIVDMQGDGGLGDVMLKNIQLLGEAQSTEKLLAIQHCNGRDYWLLAHRWGTNEFVAYRITRWGISDPVVSAVGSPHANADANYIGWLQSSSDGRRVAAAIYGDGVVEVFDFDNATGILSNAVSLDGVRSAYGVCFSPDGSKVYISAIAGDGAKGGNPNAIYQFDVSTRQADLVTGSRRLIWADSVQTDSSQTVHALQLGPDGRIYTARQMTTWLGVINNPNAWGAAASYQPQGVSLAPQQCLHGLPSVIATYYDTNATDCRSLSAGFTQNVDGSGEIGTTLRRIDPNPLHGATRIEFSLASASDARVEIYDATGTRIATLADGHLAAGVHTVRWNAAEVAAGVYYCRLSAGATSMTRPLVVVR